MQRSSLLTRLRYTYTAAVLRGLFGSLRGRGTRAVVPASARPVRLPG